METTERTESGEELDNLDHYLRTCEYCGLTLLIGSPHPLDSCMWKRMKEVEDKASELSLWKWNQRKPVKQKEVEEDIDWSLE